MRNFNKFFILEYIVTYTEILSLCTNWETVSVLKGNKAVIKCGGEPHS